MPRRATIVHSYWRWSDVKMEWYGTFGDNMKGARCTLVEPKHKGYLVESVSVLVWDRGEPGCLSVEDGEESTPLRGTINHPWSSPKSFRGDTNQIRG